MASMEPAVSEKGLTVASMIQSGEGQDLPLQRAPGLYECRGVGNSYLVTTPAGDVLVNAGTLRDARRGKHAFAQISQNPIRYIILTQSHANQFGGLEIYKTPDNEVIAHRVYPEDRAYGKALEPHMKRGSRRIFRKITIAPDDIMPTAEVAPDILIDAFHTFTLGGRRFELHSTPGGEARSALIVWLPEERIAIVGNLFGPLFGNYPNLNTMRGDKPRWALQFIDSVKTLRALRPVQILTGHEDIKGEEHIQTETTRIIDSVQWIHDRTIEGMNEGKDVRTLMRDITPPPELVLKEEYGKVAWNVRATYHEYTGWFDPAFGTTELYGVPPSSVAPALAALAGGADRLAERAAGFISEGKPLEALHLLDIALAADGASAAAKTTKEAALRLLLAQTGGKNLWERMWIASELETLNA
jgi:alkyl sulfatase BDS1-like metallo-beta-lactamase superfamily hydrolase